MGYENVRECVGGKKDRMDAGLPAKSADSPRRALSTASAFPDGQQVVDQVIYVDQVI